MNFGLLTGGPDLGASEITGTGAANQIAYFTGAQVVAGTNLYVVDVNTIEKRNGTTAQEFDIYNTYTDASNYEKTRFLWAGNVSYILTQKAGTGSIRALQFGVNNNAYWGIDTTGNFSPVTDNANTLGDATHRASNIFGVLGNFSGTISNSNGYWQLAGASNAVNLYNSGVFGFSSTGSASGGTDTGFSRVSAGVVGVGTGTATAVDGTLSFTTLILAGKTTTYSGVTTAGWGVPAIYGAGTIAATTNARSAAVATYTCGAADGTFVVRGNVLVTTASAFSFSLDCVYTDESNTSRTLVLPMAQLAGSFVASGLMTNVTGTGPYESAAMTIRCKASTSITIRPSSGGTYTGVVYNTNAVIAQLA